MDADRLEIHPAALEEITSAVTWYRKRSEPAALALVEEVDSAIDWIRRSPEQWPLGAGGTRRFILRRFPFAVVYRNRISGLQILAFAHGHRRPNYWKDRL